MAMKNTRWALLALLLPAVWGCTLVLGIDRDYHGLGGGGSGGGASASSSSASSSGSGGGCPQGEVLLGGACVIPCDGGTSECDGGCVDTTTDSANCGACGKACTGPNVCTASVCVPPHCTGALTFAAYTQYSAGSYPTGVVIADLNGDGKSDVVLATGLHNLMTGETYQVDVLINKGDGTFEAAVTYGLQHDATVGVGDLNGDGSPEIVVSNSSANTVTVLLNNGMGTFAAQPAISVTPGPSAVSVGDLNGDGKADIYWFGGGSLSALINQGNATFTGTPVTTSSFLGDAMAVGDVNGDGTIDVVSEDDLYVRVYVNKGDGTFLAPAQYNPMAPPTGISLVSWSGAGATDILVDGTVDTVLLNSGMGTFSSQINISSPPAFTVVGDMNGDGQADLVGVLPSGLNNALDVWLNGGDNTFSALVSAPVAQNGLAVVVGDLNGDGLLDMAALSQTGAETGALSVVLNTCPH